jgi:hypothetical protein
MEAPKYVKKLGETIEKICSFVRKNLHESQMRQKRDYDVRLKFTEYQVGDLVYIVNSAKKVGQSSKLNPIWKGPYVVTDILSPILFRIAGRKKTMVVHHDRMKICKDRVIPLWVRQRRHRILEGLPVETTDPDWDEFGLNNLFKSITNPSQDGGSSLLKVSHKILDVIPGNEVSASPPLPSKTRRGREVNKPAYLKDYVVN